MTLLLTEPASRHPIFEQPRAILPMTLLTLSLIEVGDLPYYDDPDGPTALESRNFPYPYGSEGLVIGPYCTLGTGARSPMIGADHRMDAPSTFPFPTTDSSWAEHFDLISDPPGRDGTIVGNNVRFGSDETVMPGVRIGHGAIIAADAAVTSDVPRYSIVGGDPARPIRTRHDAAETALLLAVAWWDWHVHHVIQHVRTIMSGAVTELVDAATNFNRSKDAS